MDTPTSATDSGLRHVAMPYRGAEEFAAGVAGLVQSGAPDADAILVACPGASQAALRPLLNRPAARVTWADVRGIGLNPARLLGAIREFAVRQGTAWCVHEPAWLARSSAELREVIRHEALLNLGLAAEPVSVLCPYDVRLGADLITAAERTHPIVFRGGQCRASSLYAAGNLIPEDFDGPLSAPPASAEVLPYREDLPAVRDFTAERARRAGLPPDRTTDLVLAVAELAANTLGHTDGPGVLRAWVTGSEIICQVNDSGQITDPLAGRLRPNDAAGGGHGLWVVNQACDLVELRSGPRGTAIRLHMRLGPLPAW